MPHLKYFGRYWRVSSDELFFPGIFAILGRLFWSTVIIVILAFSTARLSRCAGSKGLLAYLYISLAVFVMSLLCEVCLVRKSLLGSMVETGKRDKGIEKYLTAHVILCAAQFLLAIFGLFVVSVDSFIPCASTFQISKTYDLILLSVIIITQLVDISTLVCCCYTFSAKMGSKFPDQDDAITSIWENRCKSFMKCFQIFSCNIFGGSNIERDLQAVARILTAFFHHDGFLDVVPSDVMAGMILVRMQQRAKKLLLSVSGDTQSVRCSSGSDIERGGYNTTPRSVTGDIVSSPDVIPAHSAHETIEGFGDESKSDKPLSLMSVHAVAYRRDLDKNSKSDRDILKDVAKYSVHMIAMYTHLMVLYTQPCTGMYSLCCSRMKISCARFKRNHCPNCWNDSCIATSNHSPQIKGDNMCGSNHAGLSHFTRNVHSEVLYASYENDTVRKPFAVFLDEEDCSVVIAVRGSLSVEDCITDAIADPTELLEAGRKWGFDGKDRFVHGGFLSAALSIREELEDMGILDHIFKEPKVAGAADREPTLESDSGVFVGSRDCQGDLEVSVAAETVSRICDTPITLRHYVLICLYFPASIALRRKFIGWWLWAIPSVRLLRPSSPF